MLFARISTDKDIALRAGDRVRKDILGTLHSNCVTLAKNTFKKPDDLNDAEVVAQIRSGIEAARETIANYEKLGRAGETGRARFEIEVLSAYLPEQLVGAALEDAIKPLIDAIPAEERTMKSMGAVMNELKERLPGRFDGKEASGIVRRLLTKP